MAALTAIAIVSTALIVGYLVWQAVKKIKGK